MSITVANLLAQVGIDITQLKRGLNEADARMHLSAVRFAQSAKQVERMTQAAQHMEDSANAKRQRATQILADQAKIEKEIEYSQRRASDLVKTSNRVSSEKAAAQIQVKALQQSGAAYTNLTAQRNALSKAESNAAALAKQTAAAQTKHAATSLVLANALQKKQAEHVQAQTVHAQSLTKAQQKHADETIKQQQRVNKLVNQYRDEYEKNELARDANIAKAKNKVSQVEGQYNVAHRRSDAMMEEVASRHGATGIPQSVQDTMIAQHDKVEQLGRQLIQARANVANAQQTVATLPKSGDKLVEEQAKLQTLLHAPPAESAKTLAALEKATKTLRDMEAEAIKVNATQNAIVQNLERQHRAAEANKTAEEQKLAALVHGNEEYAKLVAQEKIVAEATRALVKAQRELNSEVNKQAGLEKQLEGVKSRIASLNTRAAQQSRNAANLVNRAGETEELAQARFEMENAYALRKEQDAKSHGVRAANAVSGAFIGAGVVGLGALAVGEKTGADFNQMMITAQHNTSLTNAQIKDMVATIKDLGMQSGASFDELADSYRKIENVGFKANHISGILTPAMKAAVAQGADLAETTQLLISTMRSYRQPALKAGETMNSLVAISKVANLRLGEMVKVFGFGAVNAGIYKISLAELGAAFATATDLGLDSHRVITQLNGLMVKTANPTKKMMDSLSDLDARASKVSKNWNLGKKLADDFGYGGQKAKTLLGVIEDIKKAATTLKVDPLEAITKIYNQRQGQAVAGILAGPGADRFKKNLATVRLHIKEEQDEKDYQAALKQTDRQMEILRNHFVVLASSIDDAFRPSIIKATGYIDGLMKHFNSLDEQTKTGVFDTVAIAGAAAITIGIFGKLIVGIAALKTAFAELGIASSAALGLLGRGVAVAGVAVAGGFAGNELRKNMGIMYPGEKQEADAKDAARAYRSRMLGYQVGGASQLQKEIALNQSRIAKVESQIKATRYGGTDVGRQAYANQAVLRLVKQQDTLRGILGLQQEALSGMGGAATAQSQAQKRLYGHKPEIPGADSLAGLGDKAKKGRKEKTPKESEHDQMVDNYVSAMEQLKEAEYTTLHKDMGTNEISARWATMSHGVVDADGAIHKLSGAYISMSAAEKQAYIEAGRHNDAIVKQREQLEALNSLLETNRVKYTTEQDPTGKAQILEDMMSGRYKKTYGDNAAEAIKSDIDAGKRAQAARIADAKKYLDADRAQLEEQIRAPQHENDSVAYRTERDIRSKPALAASLGEQGIKDYAKQAQAYYDTAESIKAYSNALETAKDALQKLQDEGREIGGKQTAVDALFSNKNNQSGNAAEMFMLYAIAKATDVQRGLNQEKQKSVTLTEYLANAEERARDAAITAANPNDKAGEYQRQAIQSYGLDKFNQEPTDKQAEILKQIADSYNKIIAPANRAAEANTIVADALKKVNEQFGQTHNTLVTNINDWNKLNQAQKDYLNQLQKYQAAKQTVQDAIGGISDIISKSLDDLHQHGFRNIFRDIANDFQNMLYDMGKKWVMAKITSGLQSSLAPGLNKAMGVGGAAPTPPTADMSGVDTMTVSAANVIINGGSGTNGIMPNADGSQGMQSNPLIPSWMQSAAGMIPGMPAGAPGALSALGGLFAPSAGAGAGIDFGLDSLAGSFADGGTMFSDHSYLVGERGPEIVHPMSSGQVVPMGGRGTTVNIHVHGVTDAGSFNASRHQITQDMIRAVQGAQRR